MRPLAQYGTQLVPASNLALLRGSGNFNPMPNQDSTTNRGHAYNQALNYYQNFSPQQPGPVQLQPSMTDMAHEFSEVYPTDVQDIRKYRVGTTLFHPEPENSWTRPDSYNSRGSDQYQVWAANSTNLVPNALMNFFFSTDNVNYLQSRIQQEIKKIRGIDIAPQSIDELLIIMRNKYIYAQSGWLNHPGENKPYSRGEVSRPGLSYYDKGLEVQIELLNKSVLEECVKSVLSGISMYEQYYKDSASLPMPMAPPVLTTQKGSKVLQENLAFEDGRDVSRAIASYNERFNIL
jgi:hypothetical protein